MQKIINERGQTVREYTWEEYRQKINRRTHYTGKEDLTNKTLVVKHTWGVGDILYSTPALKALKEKFSGLKIIYVCGYPDVLRENPDVDEVHHWMEVDDLMDFVSERGETWYFLNYDVPLKGGFDYKINLRTKPQLNEYLVSLIKKDPKTLVNQERQFVEQATSIAIPRYKMVALDIYCWHAFVNPEVKSVYYYPTEAELDWAKVFLSRMKALNKTVVILMPNSSTRYKDYPHWKEVIKLLPQNLFWIVMGGNPKQNDPWSGSNVADCRGAFRIRESFALCLEADLTCSSDTGLFYPRAALGRPCVVTYGPHEPEPFLHYFPSARGLRIKKLESTPGMIGMCSVGCYIDTEGCKESGDFAPCLKELKPDEVANTITEVLGSERRDASGSDQPIGESISEIGRKDLR